MPRISQFTEAQIAMAKHYAALTPPVDLDPRIEALVNDLIGRVADKWTMLILDVLAEKGTLRFTRLGELGRGHHAEDAHPDLASHGARRPDHEDGTSGRAAEGRIKLTQLGLGLGAAFCGVWV